MHTIKYTRIKAHMPSSEVIERSIRYSASRASKATIPSNIAQHTPGQTNPNPTGNRKRETGSTHSGASTKARKAQGKDNLAKVGSIVPDSRSTRKLNSKPSAPPHPAISPGVDTLTTQHAPVTTSGRQAGRQARVLKSAAAALPGRTGGGAVETPIIREVLHFQGALVLAHVSPGVFRHVG